MNDQGSRTRTQAAVTRQSRVPRVHHDTASHASAKQAYGLVLALLTCLGLSGAERLDGDTRLTLAARQALAGDTQLKDLDLGISVRQNVARLWGSVPSADLAQRALDSARRVPGIDRVIDQLVIDLPSDPQTQFLNTPKLAPEIGRTLMPKNDDVLVPDWRVPAGDPLAKDNRVPAGDPLAQAPPAPTSDLVPVWRAPAPSVPPGALASRPAPEPAATPTMPVMRLPAPGERKGMLASAGSPAATALERDVDQLRQAHPRLNTLRFEVQGGVVRFLGPVADWPALYELSRQTARLPGVQRVLLPGS